MRTIKWQQMVKLAQEAEEHGKRTISIDTNLLLAMDAYLSKLHQDLLDKTVIVGFGCSSHPIQDTCDHCGQPMEDARVNTGYGRFHIECMGPAQRQRAEECAP